MALRSNNLDIARIHDYSLDVKNRTIYIHSEMDEEESGIDFRTAINFIKNLDYLNSLSSEPITLKMFSIGGCWSYGMAIYDAIVSSKSDITFITYAHATSMSSIIPQAASKRFMTKHCDFMVHYGTYQDSGDFRQVINGVKFTETQNNVMLNIYANRCHKGEFFKESGMNVAKTRAFIKAKIEKLTDWWMTAEEAIYYGFMDKII